MTPSKFTTYLSNCMVDAGKYPEWREGQRYFNTLLSVDADLANQIRGTDLDPFYDDLLVDRFLSHVFYTFLKEDNENQKKEL